MMNPLYLVPVLAPVQVPHISGVTLVIDSGSSRLGDHIANIGTLVVSGVAAGATPLCWIRMVWLREQLGQAPLLRAQIPFWFAK